MNNRLFSEVRNAVVIFVLLFGLSIPAPSAADDRLASGKSFQLLNDEILQVAKEVSELQVALPQLVSELDAVWKQTPPEKIVVPGPCPDGYLPEGSGSSLGSLGFQTCVFVGAAEIPTPPPADPGCQDGYVLNEGLSVDGLVVCEQINDAMAAVYVTYPQIPEFGMTLTAQCPEGFIVTGGGYSSDDIEGVVLFKDVMVYSSKPLPPDQWAVGAKSQFYRPLSVYAMCGVDPNRFNPGPTDS